jgi:hypothetical protein
MMLDLLQGSGPGFFEIITKGLSTFQEIFLYVFFLITIWTGYRFIGYCIYFYFRLKLKNQNLDYFVKLLGNDYYFKKMGEGDKRYKWSKWYIIIKANFDNEGTQVSNIVAPFKYWHYANILSFQ